MYCTGSEISKFAKFEHFEILVVSQSCHVYSVTELSLPS